MLSSSILIAIRQVTYKINSNDQDYIERKQESLIR